MESEFFNNELQFFNNVKLLFNNQLLLFNNALKKKKATISDCLKGENSICLCSNSSLYPLVCFNCQFIRITKNLY